MLPSPAATSRSAASAASTARLVALGAPALDRLALLRLDRRVDGEDAAVAARQQRRGLGLGVAVDADDDLLAGLDAADALAVGVDQRGLHVVHGVDRAAVLVDDRHLGARALEQLGHEPVHDLRALEEVGVLEQVGLVGQHLLDAQRPLLVPRARQARAPRSRPAAGSRAPARRGPSVTASASSTMRWTLFSGWDSVRPSELTCTP